MTKEQAIDIIKCLAWHARPDEEEIEQAIKALEQQPCDDCVSLEVYKQVVWERDIAIEQLKELGYEFGEKIRTSDDCVSRQAVIKALNHHWLSGSCSRRIIDEQIDKVKALPPVTPTFPKGATNGDVVKLMFPNAEIVHGIYGISGTPLMCLNLGTRYDVHEMSFVEEWWNAPYKRGAKNG